MAVQSREGALQPREFRVCLQHKKIRPIGLTTMPQEFQVVRCYACEVFQVQQVKKTPKWVCKMCGGKQSLKKEYGRGSGVECRHHVQKLNMSVGESLDANVPQQLQPCSLIHSEGGLVEENHLPDEPKVKSSKWQAYIDGQNTEEEPLHEVDTPCFESSRVTLDRPQYQRRGRRECDKWNSGMKRKRDNEEQSTPEESHNPSEFSFKNNFGSTFNTSKSCEQGQMLPSQQFIDFPANTAKQFSEHKEKFQDKTGSHMKSPSRKTLKSNGNCLKTRKPEVTRCTSSKWGEFLEDTSDAEYQDEETDANLRRRETTSQNSSSDLLNSGRNSNAELENRLQENVVKEVEYSASKCSKLDRGNSSVASYAGRENRFSNMNMFSVEDESVFEEFVKDDW